METQTQLQNLKNTGNLAIGKAKGYWHALGPGLTTGAADDDPSGIATYSQAGAKYGFSFLWMSVFTFPLMAVVQEMCARIGLVTGRGLASNIRFHFNGRVLFVTTILLFLANTVNIGANLGAMSKAVQLVFPGTYFILLLFFFTALSLFLQIFVSYKKLAKILKWLALILFAYVLTAFTVDIDWPEVIKGATIPSFVFSKESVLLICGILGTTISPYLFFWQTSQEVEEQILKGKTTLRLRREVDPSEMNSMRVDVWSGMFLSNLVMFFIITVAGATLHASGITNIETAEQAASALKPLAGNLASTLFAIGIIGTGMLSIPVLATSASYAISESFGWREGLYRKFKQAHAFYWVIIVSMFFGLMMNFVNIRPIKALIYAAVANGIVAPLILALIVILSSNRKIMGEWASGGLSKFIGWITVALMSLVAFAAIISLF